MLISSSVFSIVLMRTAKTAAPSSSLGMAVCLSGATHDESNAHLAPGVRQPEVRY